MDQNGKENKVICFARGGLLSLLCVVFAFLTWYSMRFSCYIGEDYANKILTAQDSVLGNLLTLGVTGIVAAFFAVLVNKRLPERVIKIISLVTGAMVAGISIWWAFASCTTPDGDQLIVSSAAVYAKEGTLSMLVEGGYLFYYPQQLGLVAFQEIVFRIFGDYQYGVIYVLFGLMNGGTVLFGSEFLKEANFSKGVRVIYAILMIVCLPYLFYTPYVYGDIPAIFLAMVLFWCVIKWEKSGKYKFVILGCAMATMAVLMRKNSLIVILGTVIGLALMALAQKRMKHLIVALAIFFLLDLV